MKKEPLGLDKEVAWKLNAWTYWAELLFLFHNLSLVCVLWVTGQESCFGPWWTPFLCVGRCVFVPILSQGPFCTWVMHRCVQKWTQPCFGRNQLQQCCWSWWVHFNTFCLAGRTIPSIRWHTLLFSEPQSFGENFTEAVRRESRENQRTTGSVSESQSISPQSCMLGSLLCVQILHTAWCNGRVRMQKKKHKRLVQTVVRSPISSSCRDSATDRVGKVSGSPGICA